MNLLSQEYTHVPTGVIPAQQLLSLKQLFWSCLFVLALQYGITTWSHCNLLGIPWPNKIDIIGNFFLKKNNKLLESLLMMLFHPVYSLDHSFTGIHSIVISQCVSKLHILFLHEWWIHEMDGPVNDPGWGVC